MVDCAALETRWPFRGSGGSNPSLSSSFRSVVAQLVERLIVGQEAFGSIPNHGTKTKRLAPLYSPLAQLVERLTVNRIVAGSSPAGGAQEFSSASLGFWP